jgi:hypothetical protein
MTILFSLKINDRNPFSLIAVAPCCKLQEPSVFFYQQGPLGRKNVSTFCMTMKELQLEENTQCLVGF